MSDDLLIACRGWTESGFLLGVSPSELTMGDIKVLKQLCLLRVGMIFPIPIENTDPKLFYYVYPLPFDLEASD